MIGIANSCPRIKISKHKKRITTSRVNNTDTDDEISQYESGPDVEFVEKMAEQMVNENKVSNVHTDLLMAKGQHDGNKFTRKVCTNVDRQWRVN
jgi:hypothetical protein